MVSFLLSLPGALFSTSSRSPIIVGVGPDEVAQQPWIGTLEENIVQKSFEHEYFEGEVFGVEASAPSLRPLEQSPVFFENI